MTKTLFIHAAAVLALCAVGCASSGEATRPASEPSSQAAPDRADALKDASLRSAIEDKTHAGDFMGKPYKAYFAADGAVEADVSGDPFIGRWSIEGPDTFCIEWSAPAIPKGCSWIVLDGANVGGVYKVDDGSLRATLKIMSGKQL